MLAGVCKLLVQPAHSPVALDAWAAVPGLLLRNITAPPAAIPMAFGSRSLWHASQTAGGSSAVLHGDGVTVASKDLKVAQHLCQ